MFPLQIFPEGSLSESVVTTVWVGVVVVAFFNLRFGWPFSGLVVPGYLVPIMIAKPLAAVVVCVEGMITFGIVKFVSDRLAGVPGRSWSSMFGRDRFLALVICSLLVRITLDGWVLPVVGELINSTFNVEFDYRNNLCSFGLIIVALISNQFWKTGLLRGLVPFCIQIGVTYVGVRYVLMECTNFNIGNLEYMYESISSSLLASPKAYVILITTAFLASRINLLYGWDFNGILIPSLLALQWYQPTKILTSFVEALVILFVAILLLRTPWYRDKTIEGSRKLLLFFNISFVYKMVIAYGCQVLDVATPATEFFGFGYLLSTLVAIKMHNMNKVIRFVRSTTQMSLVGALVANFVGLALTFSPEMWTWSLPRVEAVSEDPGRVDESRLIERLRLDKLRMYQRRGADEFILPLPQEIDVFDDAVERLIRYARRGSEYDLRAAQSGLATIGYAVDRLEGDLLYVREANVGRGWGVYVVNLVPASELIVEVPAPLDEWAVLESGSHLFRAFDARALAVAGSRRRATSDAVSDVLVNGRTLYHVFHRHFADGGVLQVRGYARKTLDELLSQARPTAEAPEGAVPWRSGLWVKGQFPAGIGYRDMRALLGPYGVIWGGTPFPNLQRDDMWAGFCELVLGREDRKRLLSKALVDSTGDRANTDSELVVPSLVDVVRRAHERMALEGTDAYRPAREEELLFIDSEILVPVLQLVEEAELEEDRLLEGLRVLDAVARAVDYRVRFCRGGLGGRGYVVLEERDDVERPRNWGTYVFRVGGGAPYFVQVPRPLAEGETTWLGMRLFEQLDGRILLLAGAHPYANRDGTADLVRRDNRVNLLSATHQVALREAGAAPRLVLQVRGFGFRGGAELVPSDALVACADGTTEERRASVLTRAILDRLRGHGLTVRLTGGEAFAAGYDAAGVPQAAYPAHLVAKEFCVLWASPFLRAELSADDDETADAARFARVGIETRSAPLYELLEGLGFRRSRTLDSDEVVRLAGEYLRTRDVRSLAELRDSIGPASLERVIDTSTARSCGVVIASDRSSAVVFKLGEDHGGEALRVPGWELSSARLDDFWRSSTPYLVVGGGR